MKNRACIAAVIATIVGGTPAMSASLCETVGEKYRGLLRDSKPEMPQYVVLNLSRSASSSVTSSDSLVENADAAKLQAWAKALKPPVTLSQELLDSIADNTDARQDLDRLPGTNFYSVNGTAGTLSCYQPGTYFQIDNGQVQSASGPADLEEEGGGCQVIRYFGSVDSTPVIFQEGSPDSGEVLLTIVPWNGSGFDASCTAAFKFDAADKLVDVTVK